MGSTNARLAAASAVVFALLLALALPTFAFASTFASEYPFGTIHLAPSVVAVDLFDSAPLNPSTARMMINGVAEKVFLTNVGSASGHWASTETQQPSTGAWTVTWKWVADTGGATKATLTCYPTSLSDGVKSVTASVKDANGATLSDAWSFVLGIAPTLGPPTPASGSTVAVVTPAISVPVTDNGPATMSATATVDGLPASASVSGGVARVTSPVLPNDATATVTVTVTDAAGNKASKTWSFFVETYPDMFSTLGACTECHHDDANHSGMVPGLGWSDCQRCHSVLPHTGTPLGLHAKANVSGCSPCHVSDLTVEHARHLSGAGTAITCTTCHASADPKVASAIAAGDSSCAACHAGASHESLHTTTVTATCFGTGCHSGTSLTSIHINSSTTLTCDSCHTSTDPKVVAAISGGVKDCTACHGSGGHTAVHEATLGTLTSIQYHDGTLAVSENCVTCHASTNLMTLHANDCSLCHSGSNPAGSFTTWTKGCQQGACHPTIHQNEATGHEGDPACPDCHGDYGTPVIPCTDCHATGADTSAPSTVSNALAAYVGPASITLTATDDRLVKATYYRLDGGATTTVNGAVFVASPASGIQSHTLEFWSSDWSGNVESPRNTALFTCSADTQPPVTTSDAKANYAGPVTITLTPTDNSTLGVRTTYYRFDSGPIQTGTTATLPQPPSGTEAHTVYFWSVDYAGNIESQKSAPFTINVDAVAPTTTSNLLPAPKWYPGAGSPGRITISLYPTDPAPSSGIASVYVDSTNASTWWGDGHNAGYNSSAGAWQLGMWVYASGNYPVTWYATDNAGNAESPKTTIIQVDAERPKTTCNAASGATYQGAQTFTLSATDTGGSGLASTWYRLDSGSWTQGTSVPVPAPASGTVSHTISWYSMDNAGNQEFQLGTSVTFNVQAPPDTIAPTGSIVINNGAAWTNSTAATLTVSASDNVGVYQMRFSNDNVTWSTWETYSTAIKNWTLVTGNGTKTVYAQYKDAAGNVSATASSTIGLDGTAPVTTSNATGGQTYVGAQLFTLSPTDAGGSGLSGTWWQLDSTAGAWTSGTSVSVPAPGSGTVSHTIYWYSTDAAGNREANKSVTFNVSAAAPDVIAPTGSVVINNGAAWTNSTAATLTVSASDNVGVYQMRFSNDNVTWSTWETYSTATKNWPLATGNGPKTVYAQYKDAAGNVSATVNDTIGLDGTAPTTTSNVVGGQTYTGAQTFTLTPSDTGGSGVASTWYQLDTGAWTSGTSVPVAAPSSGSVSHTISWYSTDNATNKEATKTVAFTVAAGSTSPGSIFIDLYNTEMGEDWALDGGYDFSYAVTNSASAVIASGAAHSGDTITDVPAGSSYTVDVSFESVNYGTLNFTWTGVTVAPATTTNLTRNFRDWW